jgi:hypothetical protein
MSDEIKVTVKVGITKGDLSLTRTVNNHTSDQTGDGMQYGVQNVGTSDEPLEMGDIGTAGICYLRNLDDTNYVEIGQDSGGFVALMKLLPGEVACGRLATDAPRAKANTGAIELEYLIFEN